ncbi:NAD(P)-binding Rossmann-like domain protein [Candidatus Methanoperedenaceae archaeon GB37]|nr:NAD(P)-binding Rossmann-like domain protein [Candidatus Methanoperedenaceae archaeon GB37]
MDVVIGGGVGGLLAAARLSALGRRVLLFEKRHWLGGRFTNIVQDGFTLSTGALHMLPHGSRGPTAAMLEKLKIPVVIIDSDPHATIFLDGRMYTEREFRRLLSLRARFSLFWKWIGLRRSVPDMSYREFIEGVGSDLLTSFTDAFSRFTFSVSSEDLPLWEALMATAYTRFYGGPGIVKGGCKSVIDGLSRYIQEHNGRICTDSPVDEILLTSEGSVEGVSVNGEVIRCSALISDIGPRETLALIADRSLSPVREFEESVKGIRPVFGIKISFSSDRSLIGHSGVMFTPECRRVGGVVEVTAADPSLAPAGMHLYMSHQHLPRGDLTPHGVRQEIDLGLEDLGMVFQSFTEDDVLLVQTYIDEPVNRALQGSDLDPITPIKGLYLAGDGVKDGIEVEGIARSVETVIESIVSG